MFLLKRSKQFYLLIVAAVVCLSLFFVVSVQGAAKKPKIDLKVFVETSGRGLAPTQAQWVAVFPPPLYKSKKIQIKTPPLLDEYEILAVQEAPFKMGINPKTRAVSLKFENQASTVLNTVTLSNRGRYLVVMLNGRPVLSAKIDKPIQNGVIYIPGDVKPEEIVALRAMAKRNLRDRKIVE